MGPTRWNFAEANKTKAQLYIGNSKIRYCKIVLANISEAVFTFLSVKNGQCGCTQHPVWTASHKTAFHWSSRNTCIRLISGRFWAQTEDPGDNNIQHQKYAWISSFSRTFSALCFKIRAHCWSYGISYLDRAAWKCVKLARLNCPRASTILRCDALRRKIGYCSGCECALFVRASCFCHIQHLYRYVPSAAN